MKWSFATIGIILLGLIGVSIILLFQQITTNNENDYYLLKEVTEASMIDAIDIPYYRETGNLKIIKEKFVENFTRRFAESTIFVTNEYTIDFYEIMEEPPKVSIIVNTGLGEYTVGGNAAEYDISNKLDAILEYTGEDTFDSINKVPNPYKYKNMNMVYYAILSSDNKDLSLKVPAELIAPNIKNIKIEDIEYGGVVTSQGELNMALLKNELLYNGVTTNYMQFIDDFNKDIEINDISFYNCNSRDGKYKSSYDCKNNDYFISINNNFGGKIAIKYEITWSYMEYEFSN